MAAEIIDLGVYQAFERRQRLRERIARMGAAIAAGEIHPSRVELDQVIGFCVEYFLPVEAAKVARWMSGR